MNEGKQELICPLCGCNHMYVDTYKLPMRPDEPELVLSKSSDDIEFSDYGRQYTTPLPALIIMVLLCATIVLVAWLIWG